MTADRSAATHEEFAARVAPFDAAPAAEESAVERVARAIAAGWADRWPDDNEPWENLRETAREDYRFDARVAIDAMRPAPDAPRADDPVVYGIRPHMPMTAKEAAERRRIMESLPPITAEQLREQGLLP
jgi:hypothetical protein